MNIREYREDDRDALHRCVAELQDFERALEPLLPPGEEIAEPYLDFLLGRCRESAGRVFVAEVDGKVGGFIGVLARVRSQEPDDPADYAFVTDLLVLPSCRKRGVGEALLRRAEDFARESGAHKLRVAILARNERARAFYGKLGFSDYQLQLAKELGD